MAELSLDEKLKDVAKHFEVKGKYNLAIRVYDELVETQKKSSEGKKSIAETLNLRGIAKRGAEDYIGAKKDYEIAFNKAYSDEQKASALINISDIQRVFESDFKGARSSLKDAIDNYCESGSLVHAKALDFTGLAFVAEERYHDAIESYKPAKNICEELIKSEPDNKDVKNRLGQIVHHLGVAYKRTGEPENMDKAYQSQIDALEILAKLEDQQGIVNCVSALGDIALAQDRADEALNYFKRAEKILEETGYGRAIASLSLQIAEAHFKKQEAESAVPYLKRFAQGVENQKLTRHDLGLIKNDYERVSQLYESSGINVPGFEKIHSYFSE